MVPHPPLFKAPTPCSTPPFFKIVVSPHLCFIALPFRQYHPTPPPPPPSPLTQISPALIQPTYLSWFKQISKR